jgi:phage/plasmid primase-like uncharacterized protein
MYDNLNSIDLKEQCRSYMAEQGLSLEDQLITDGRIHRYSVDAKKSKPDEWYVAYEGCTSQNNPYLSCTFGSWSKGEQYEYKSYDQETRFNEYEKKELKQVVQNQRLKVEQEVKISYDTTAKEAQKLWDGYLEEPPSKEYQKYAELKKINLIGGVRFGLNPWDYPAIVIPIKNSAGILRSLQYISLNKDAKSHKSFLAGGEKKGNFHIIGNVTEQEESIFVAEGYATAVSIHEATNKPVVIAFDVGNLEPVIENINNKFPHLAITIAGDNDDAGRKKALNAAIRFGCRTIFPMFAAEIQREGDNDFNDLYQIAGIDVVQKQLMQGISDNDLKRLAESFLSDKEEPCDSFKLSKLPIPLREYIAILCKTTNAHPIMVVSSVLTMVSAFIGTKAFVSEGEYFQDLYPNLWILCIAKSGQFKTTALNKGAKISYDKQAQVFKAIKALQSGLPEGQDQQQILNKSRENIVLPTKLTAEAFLEYLGQGHQGAIYTSEFGGWLQNLDKSHNNDFKAILTEFYDVPSYYRYKTKTQGDCIIETPYISICGVSTMPWITANLKPSDVPSGFFARFLIFVPPYQDGIPAAFPALLDNSCIDAEQKFKDLIGKILESIGEQRSFYLADDARQLIEKFHIYIYQIPKTYSDRAEEILQPYLKRWSPYLIKLSMITQLFIDYETDRIGSAAVISAMSLLIPAMKSTAMLFEGELGESEHQRKCRIIFEWMCQKIKDTGKPIKRHTVISSKKLDGGSKDYDYVLQTLIDQGKIKYQELQKKNESEYRLAEKIEES